jgi:hypothetical protein
MRFATAITISRSFEKRSVGSDIQAGVLQALQPEPRLPRFLPAHTLHIETESRPYR